MRFLPSGSVGSVDRLVRATFSTAPFSNSIRVQSEITEST